MALVKRGKSYGVVIHDRGRRIWIGTYPSRAAAKDAEASALLDRRSLGGSLTVAQFASTWLDRYPRTKPSTIAHYQQTIRTFTRDYGTYQLRDLRRAELRAWALEHQAAAKVARAMLGDAFRDELIRDNPLAGLRLPEGRGRKDIEALTEDDILRLAETAREAHGLYGREMYAPMILLAAYSGLRPGELQALRWDDIEPDTIRVERQYSPKASALLLPKNGRKRRAPLLPQARDALAQIRHAHGHENIFLTIRQKPFTGRVAHYYWNPVRTMFGRPEMEWYELRHFFGSYLARLGLSAPEIARAMGHTDGGRIALERYIHVSERDAFESVQSAVRRSRLRVVDNAPVSNQDRETG